ncbi:MAG: hypothetical protein JXR51_01630 [Bacteroidales bacterium]|nr:hypothetical protein [Bacteroidales bacterium]
MNKIILILFLLFLIIRCNNNSHDEEHKTNNQISDSLINMESTVSELKEGTINIYEDDFGEIIELIGKAFDLHQIFKPKEVEMILKDDYLILKTIQNKNMFMVFSIPEFKLVHSCGVQGVGPDEFVYPNLVQTEEEDKLCYVYAPTNEKLYYLTNDFKLINCTFGFPKGKIRASAEKQIHVLSKNELLYVRASDKGKKIIRLLPDSVEPETEMKT